MKVAIRQQGKQIWIMEDGKELLIMKINAFNLLAWVWEILV